MKPAPPVMTVLTTKSSRDRTGPRKSNLTDQASGRITKIQLKEPFLATEAGAGTAESAFTRSLRRHRRLKAGLPRRHFSPGPTSA